MVVIVEAAQPSGSLITADLAAKLGRTVGAVPGQLGVRVAEGANDLIKDGAHLIRDARDVLDLLFGVGLGAGAADPRAGAGAAPGTGAGGAAARAARPRSERVRRPSTGSRPSAGSRPREAAIALAGWSGSATCAPTPSAPTPVPRSRRPNNLRAMQTPRPAFRPVSRSPARTPAAARASRPT